jgi:CHAT domain-containing protein
VASAPAESVAIRSVRWWRVPTTVSYVRLAAAAVVVLAVGLGIWRLFFYRSEVNKGLAALAYAYREQRPTESRISELEYAPPPPITQGPDLDKLDYLALDRAKALIQLEAYERPSAQALHNLGRLYLAQHEFDKAIGQLEKALTLDEKNAQLHSDLGAALLEKAKAQRKNGESTSPETFSQSLTHLDRSLDLDPSLHEALFNRALCRQEINLFDQAESDWREYLERDQNSKWAEEAKLKLQELQERKRKGRKKEDLLTDFVAAYEAGDNERAWIAFSQSRFRTGNVIAQALIEAYLSSSALGMRDDARRAIEKVGYAGAIETHKVGDRFTADLAEFYKHANRGALRELGKARRLMASADNQSNETEYEQAIKLYSTARSLFEGIDDTCDSIFAQIWVGISNRRIAPKESLRILESLVPVLESKSYKYLLAMCLNGIGDAQFSRRELTKSLDSGNRAYETSEEIEDFNSMLRNLQFQVAMQQQLGEYNESLASIFRAFDFAKTFSPDPKEIWAYYHQSALNYYSLGHFRTALDFQTEAMQVAAETGLTLYKSRSYAQAGLILESLKKYDEAIKNVQLALGEGQKIKGHKSRLNLVANSTLSLAHLYKEQGDLTQALSYYDKAIELHRNLDIEIYLFQAHKGRLLTLIGLNDDTAAEHEMQTAVAMIEGYRPKISEEADRNAFFDLAQSVYDTAIDFSCSRLNSPQDAFGYAEASHARSLLELMKATSKVVRSGDKRGITLSSSTSPRSLSEIERALTNIRTQIIMYSVLDDRLIIWVVSGSGCESKERRITADALGEAVRGFVEAVRDPRSSDQEVTKRATELYGLLIDPIEEFLDPGGDLCIVPDKVLNYLPFCSLVSPRTDKYFVQERAFALAPSSTVFLSCSDEARRRGGQTDERFLIVANPTQDLAPTEDEAREVSSLYKLPKSLIGPQATKSRVKSEMTEADVVEFASHYVPDPRSPMRSRLLLAKGREGDDEDLEASEIYDMRLPRTRLVVLSACQTGVEQAYRGEGAIGMARPFIKAGVPTVVATLWPIEASASSALMTSFHRYRSKGASTTDALRRAQTEMIETNERYRHPYYWAAFAAIGG